MIEKPVELYKAIAEGRAISSLCLKKQNGAFTENEEGSVHMLLRTHFPEFYPTAENDNMPDTPTTNKK